MANLGRVTSQAGIDVVIGGSHVSGCFAMLPKMPTELQEAAALGITLFSGECEDHLDEVIRDAAGGSFPWSKFYSEDHIETILRHAHAVSIDLRRLALVLLWFSAAVPIESLHPLQADTNPSNIAMSGAPACPDSGGSRSMRGKEPMRHASAMAFAKRWHKLEALCRRIARENPCRSYMDIALTTSRELRYVNAPTFLLESGI